MIIVPPPSSPTSHPYSDISSNQTFYPDGGCVHSLYGCVESTMSAGSSSSSSRSQGEKSKVQLPRSGVLPQEQEQISASASTTHNDLPSTSWPEDPSQLGSALPASISFDFGQIMIPDTNNLIDFGVSLDDLMPRITEQKASLSLATSSTNSIGNSPQFTVENEGNRQISSSPSLLYQPPPFPPSQQHSPLPALARKPQPINKQNLHQNTTISESTGSDTPSSQDSGDDRLTEKRRRNKLAAQRLRQKKLDRISNLESRLEEVTKERDELRLRLAKWEGEAMAMRQLFDRKIKE